MTEKYFDLHVVGIGYLSRAREVPVRRGELFVAVEINALHGAADQVQYTRFDCRVAGAKAQALVRQFMSRINDREAKVLIGFRLGDLYPDVFTYRSGDKAGQTGVALKARLLTVQWIKVDGEMLYTAPTDAVPPGDEAEGGTGEASTPGHRAEDDVSAYLPEAVCLSRDDPDFLSKKARLRASGYRFDGKHKVWRLTAAA
jgi:hypothetical protein